MKACVIGAGVIGLCSAIRLAESGCSVVCVSNKHMKDTTSMTAGAYWWPYRVGELSSEVIRLAITSCRALHRLSENPQSGVRVDDVLRYSDVISDETELVNQLQAERLLGQEEPRPFSHNKIPFLLYRLPVIDVPIYMNFLRERAESLGVVFNLQDVSSIDDVFSDYDVLINCSGLGARELVSDSALFSVQGQVLRVEKPEGLSSRVFTYHRDGKVTLIIPRTKDCILGGSAVVGNESIHPSAELEAELLQRAGALLPELKNAMLIESKVGLRPCRERIRLSSEKIDEKRMLIHNYGHGGGGFSLSWGCADRVCELLTS